MNDEEPQSRLDKTTNEPQDATRKIRTKQTAVLELIEGATLYALCIFLPTLLGIFVKYYEGYQSKNSTPLILSLDDTEDYLVPGWIYDVCKYYFRWFMSILCNPNWSPLTSHCTQDAKGHWHGPLSSYFAAKASAAAAGVKPSVKLSDLQFIIVLSTCLALLRIYLVHRLVPKVLEEQQLKAMLRCKSMHVLSRANFNAFESPRPRKITLDPSSATSSPPASLFLPEDPIETSSTTSTYSAPTAVTAQHERRSSWSPADSETFRRIRGSIHRSLGHEDASLYDDPKILETSSDATKRLFRAPRYATAVFRLLYLIMSTMYAWGWFHTAAFWPRVLGGTARGQTQNCWDLSGNVHLTSLDSDFDHKNEHLRYYFIIQGSYHFHSLGFQLISLLVLLLTSSNHEQGPGKWLFMRKSMTEYIRPLSEHMTAVLLIGAAFLFSGLRRLGALGMYTMDLSGIFLQLLQVCLNSPLDSRFADIQFIRLVHSYLAIPFFLYCRLFVLPFVIWYSVAFESLEWFRQIERVLVPGSGTFLYLTFNSLLLVIQLTNILYLKRLLQHPQVKKLKDIRDSETSTI